MEIYITKRKALKSFITSALTLVAEGDMIFTAYDRNEQGQILCWNERREFIGQLPTPEVADSKNFDLQS